jgi:O-antigen/teichoic acid export membrane protein
VPRRILIWNIAALVVCSAGLVTLGPPLLRFGFPNYAAATSLLVPFAFFNLFAGLFQPYNMFLASHGRGAELRNIAVVVTIATFVGLFVAVPRYGISGAAWSGVVAMALDYLLHLYYYRRSRRELVKASI